MSSLSKLLLFLMLMMIVRLYRSFPETICRYQPLLGSYFAFRLSKHFKMYIIITDIMGKKRIDLAYLIQNLDTSKEVTVVSMVSNNVQYWIKEPLKVMLLTNEEKWLPKGVFMDGAKRFHRKETDNQPTGCQQ